MHEKQENAGTGAFEFIFQVNRETDLTPLVNALQGCTETGAAEPKEPRLLTLRGQFDFDTAVQLAQSARQTSPWYAPQDASITPPLTADIIQEALDIMLEFQQEDEDTFVWTHIPTAEMPRQVFHDLHRMVAAEWVRPDYERPDIAMVSTPEASQGKHLRELLSPWRLTPERLFQKEL